MRTIKRLIPVLLVLVLLLNACQAAVPTGSPAASPTSLPTPNIVVDQAPDVEAAAKAYLDAWKAEDYAGMYAMLSKLTRDAMTPEAFNKTHKDAAVSLTMQSMDYAILSSMVNPGSAQVSYQITYTTTLLNEISRSTLMNLVLEDHVWHVQWEAGMLLPELEGGNHLELVLEVPARGNIYSSSGYPMAAQDDAVAIGLVPGEINADNEDDMVALLSRLTGLTDEQIRRKYEYAQSDWYVPIADLAASEAEKNADALARYPAIQLSPFRSRYYYDGGLAPHVLGYVLSISAEELEAYQRNGYRGDEKVGYTGLEAWGEKFLAGTHGATLYVKDAQGQIVTRIGSAEAKAAASIYTTIDSALQYDLQHSMGDYLGAIVVMERDTGRIISMVSNPGFDPNLFEPTNINAMELNSVLQDAQLPLYNRASQGVYPLGSVFKIITMAAALETGVFTPDYPYYCDTVWTELDGVTKLYDWTYEKDLGPSGLLTLKQGLMRSCNPWFWHIGLTLWNDGYESAITDVARGFGLGKLTGVEIPEREGNLQQPESASANVQLAIGQSTLQVSPLQVARFVAAVGNGGTLYRPSLVEKIAYLDGDPLYTFKPEAMGTLPVTADNLKAIQEAMVSVIRDPRGTANYQFRGFSWNVAGKTGTAENPAGDSHAWFAGYTFNNDPNKPDIAVAIILENAGEGSELAAPLFRRVVSLYFSDGKNTGGTMPWEDSPYVPSTPTPEASTTTP